MSDNWTKDIKRLAENHVRNVPEGLLDNVKSEMLRRGLMPTAQPTKVVTLRRWRYAAAAAVVAIVAGIGLTTFRHTDSGNIAAVIKTRKNVPDTEIPITGVQESGITERLIAQVARRAAAADKERSALHGITAPQPADTTVLVAQNETPQPTNKPQPHHTVGSTSRDNTPHTPTRHRDSSWSVGAYCGGAANANPAEMNPVFLTQYDGYGVSSPVYFDSKSQAQMEEIGNKKESHHQTVKVGVSLRYNLDSRWSLQTGVTYTRLTSDFTEETGTTTVDTKQKLDYIGIPLNVSYNIWQNSHLIIYATAGGAVEKLVSGAATTETAASPTQKTLSSNSVTENRPVFSASLAAGIEYKANQYLSVYAQPGVTRHFDNGSGIKSIYTDKPLNMELNLGVRININK